MGNFCVSYNKNILPVKINSKSIPSYKHYISMYSITLHEFLPAFTLNGTVIPTRYHFFITNKLYRLSG